jgi:hypothetical protein
MPPIQGTANFLRPGDVDDLMPGSRLYEITICDLITNGALQSAASFMPHAMKSFDEGARGR